MTLEEAKKILGKDAERMTDDQIMEELSTAEFLAELLIDSFMSMSPEGRKRFSKKNV